MATAEMDVSQLSFEAALQRLEEIVRTLEKGEAPLDKSIELYQEGDRLKRHCDARLKDAQARIEQIAFGMPKASASAPMSTAFSRNCSRRRGTAASGFTRPCATRRSAVASDFARC
jgi:exodeoxyribonuclease VII small subunit